jgi:hypothetical protein
MRADLAEMFCKRVATKLKNAKDELEEIRKQQQALVERMIGDPHLDVEFEAEEDVPAAA